MELRNTREILLSFADDTRLRVIGLLNKGELSVSELCQVIGSSQPNLSRHLSRLRLTGLVGDRREGTSIFYFIAEPKEPMHAEILESILKSIESAASFQQDLSKLESIKKSLDNQPSGEQPNNPAEPS